MEADALHVAVAGALLALGVAASLVADRLRVPALVLFLGLGMLIGTDGLGWIDFEDYELARLIGGVALSLILYDAGLTTGLDAIRPVLRPAIALALIATIVTAVVSGAVATVLFDLPAEEGLLLGAILAATDGAAVFALLRSTPLPPRLARTLEAESGLNDPVAVLLVLAGVNVITTDDYTFVDAVLFFASELAIGAAVGLAVGSVAMRIIGRWPMPHGLNLVASLATAALAFGVAGILNGSGFLAVYLAGLAVGSGRSSTQHELRTFHKGLATVAEIGLFFALGLLVFPSQLGSVMTRATVLALVVTFLGRPLGTMLATLAGGRFTIAERTVIAWAGLRGAIPVVLATLPVIEGVPRSLEFFNIVFFAVLVSTLIQGTTIGVLARRLRVAVD